MLNLNSRFSEAPVSANIQRSKFKRPSDHKFTMSAGLLYPIFVDEVLPGDTFSMDTRMFCRMSTPIHPVMDQCYMDIYYFYIPYRTVWNHFKEFMGEPSNDIYSNPTEYTIPALIPNPEDGAVPKTPCFRSVADYMGIPPVQNLPSQGISALPFRAYAKVFNEWFRSETLMPGAEFPMGDEDQFLYGCYPNQDPNTADFANPYKILSYPDHDDFSYPFTAAYGGHLCPVAKFHDYFTSALTQPQRGDPVPIPLSGFAPVIPLDQTIEGYKSFPALKTYTSRAGDGILAESASAANDVVLGYSGATKVAIANGFADLSQLQKYSPIVANISDLRYAFQMQKFLEADNRYGTRYTELIRGHFGVTAPDASLQRSEILGGKRIRINMSQVLQTSSTDSTSPQGNTAAYSATLDVSNSFSKSFTEHGIVLGLACIRAEHTYQQGIERFWGRKDKFDFYFPEFAHISEQPIYNYQIFNGTNKDYEVFGFQEAWAEYRYKPNRISGEMRSTYPQSLDVWHYGDDYAALPSLNPFWILEPRGNIDRTLAVASENSDQFICDFYFDLDCVRPMPVYSIPGLADHF